MRQISKTILKSLLGEPATAMYPARPREYPAGARGQLAIEIEKCIFCGLCAKKCPTRALKVSREKKAWEIDRLKCITCGACVDACPKKCLALKPPPSLPQTKRASDAFIQKAAPPASPSPAPTNPPA